MVHKLSHSGFAYVTTKFLGDGFGEFRFEFMDSDGLIKISVIIGVIGGGS